MCTYARVCDSRKMLALSFMKKYYERWECFSFRLAFVKKIKKKEPIELINNRLKFLIELTIEETLYKSEILYN